MEIYGWCSGVYCNAVHVRKMMALKKIFGIIVVQPLTLNGK